MMLVSLHIWHIHIGEYENWKTQCRTVDWLLISKELEYCLFWIMKPEISELSIQWVLPSGHLAPMAEWKALLSHWRNFYWVVSATLLEMYRQGSFYQAFCWHIYLLPIIVQVILFVTFQLLLGYRTSWWCLRFLLKRIFFPVFWA